MWPQIVLFLPPRQMRLVLFDGNGCLGLNKRFGGSSGRGGSRSGSRSRFRNGFQRCTNRRLEVRVGSSSERSAFLLLCRTRRKIRAQCVPFCTPRSRGGNSRSRQSSY
ncbi:hypothetical protein RSOL_452450 [Rhizoctonia solani AG-3 Rhs1AP]|uniref:Uncharacterized protein n=2 Tax=Rhizoctonia solani AG-3 TaxID=1086053 RepID=A0A074RX15_9AGAM|nr:hypothetical protein RSOL_452450 [Rhizoctonia solani AG-3 Rhs1AP]KEP51484.1 hypothetical protein V565_061010 [Rhizoctonia solani 123E]